MTSEGLGELLAYTCDEKFPHVDGGTSDTILTLSLTGKTFSSGLVQRQAKMNRELRQSKLLSLMSCLEGALSSIERCKDMNHKTFCQFVCLR